MHREAALQSFGKQSDNYRFNAANTSWSGEWWDANGASGVSGMAAVLTLNVNYRFGVSV